MHQRNHYDVLRVSRTATQDEIKAAWKHWIKFYHPDLFPEGHRRDTAEEESKAVNIAYEILSDPRRRALYDDELKSRDYRRTEPPHENDRKGSSRRTGPDASEHEKKAGGHGDGGEEAKAQSYDEILAASITFWGPDRDPKRVDLIKALRDATGLGLKQAMDVVEEYLARVHGIPRASQAKGCNPFFLLLLIVAGRWR